jgi:hypothetical protein
MASRCLAALRVKHREVIAIAGGEAFGVRACCRFSVELAKIEFESIVTLTESGSKLPHSKAAAKRPQKQGINA